MGAIDSIANMYMSDKASKTNVAEAQKARDFSERMWQQTNFYNSPQNQKALLQQAGLNPNMLYAQGGVDASASLADPGAQATANSPNPADFNPLSTLGDLQSLDLQSINIQREKIKREQDVENLNLLKEQIVGQRVDNARKKLDNFKPWFERSFTMHTFAKFLGYSDFSVDELGQPLYGTYAFDDDDINYFGANEDSLLLNIFKSWQAEGVGVDEAKTRIAEMNKSIELMQKELESMEADADFSQALSSLYDKLPNNAFGDICRVLLYIFSGSNLSFGASVSNKGINKGNNKGNNKGDNKGDNKGNNKVNKGNKGK